MNYPDYFRLLGLNDNASVEEIKKAYRQKARMYHPDLNHAPDAKEKFIQVTEAYEFLIANYNNLKNDDEAYWQAMEDWRKYRQNRSRQRAHAYAHASYARFKNTSFYKTTRIFDATRIVFGLVLSILVIIYTILGYIIRLRNPLPYYGNPLFAFIVLLILGVVFFIVSLIYLRAYLETNRKRRKKS
jgi:hypothetical protein